jgi:ankyrin repeat protein
VKALLAAGADVQRYSEKGPDTDDDYLLEDGCRAPIHFAAAGLATDYSSTDTASVAVLDLLLQAGATLSDTTTAGCTPLWVLVRHSSDHRSARCCERIELLLQRGASLEDYSPTCGSLLHAAAGSSSVKVLQFLLSKGLSLSDTGRNSCTATGATPLMCAAAAGCTDMIKELIAQGCDVNAVCRDASNALSAYVGAPDCYSADGCELCCRLAAMR